MKLGNAPAILLQRGLCCPSFPESQHKAPPPPDSPSASCPSIGVWGGGGACLRIRCFLCRRPGSFTIRAECCVSDTIQDYAGDRRWDDIRFPLDFEMWAGLRPLFSVFLKLLDDFVVAVQEIGFDIPVSEVQSVVTTAAAARHLLMHY